MQNNDRRIDPLTKPWDRLPNYDIPGEIDAGWRCGYQGNNHYDSNGLSNYQNRTRDHVVTRPEGYVPYQSVVQPDGRYAYNPHRTQYPRTRNEEYDAGRTALLPAARQYEFMLNRSDNYVHRPGEVVTMGIDYDQMRTAPIRQPQQPMMDQYGRPVVQGPIHGSMGPPPLPHMYGSYYGGQR
jgi:hypothetical protein